MRGDSGGDHSNELSIEKVERRVGMRGKGNKGDDHSTMLRVELRGETGRVEGEQKFLPLYCAQDRDG